MFDSQRRQSTNFQNHSGTVQKRQQRIVVTKAMKSMKSLYM